MGCGSSVEERPEVQRAKETPADTGKSHDIDKDLAVARQAEEDKVKLLLLGAGESGKSTVFKQMRILYGSDRSDDDMKLYGVVVRSNIITATRKLCGLIRTLQVEGTFDEEPAVTMDNGNELSPKEAFALITGHLIDGTLDPDDLPEVDNTDDWVGRSARAGLGANNDAKQLLQLWREIKVLWESSTMKDVWQKRAQANIIDSHKDYLNDINRIASPKFRPSQQDVLLARVKTTQVVMERYRIDGVEFEMYDVGGQRSERRKWIDCFDSVDAVIFVAALSEYDQSLAESRRTNRMIEAIDLFKSVCNNRAFSDTSIMLFLNKKDLFADKILYSNIADQKPFADYAGPPQDFNSGVQYFIQRFQDCLIDDDFNESFIHVTCATDTNNMEFVLDSTRSIIMSQNLQESGFLGAG